MPQSPPCAGARRSRPSRPALPDAAMTRSASRVAPSTRTPLMRPWSAHTWSTCPRRSVSPGWCWAAARRTRSKVSRRHRIPINCVGPSGPCGPVGSAGTMIGSAPATRRSCHTCGQLRLQRLHHLGAEGVRVVELHHSAARPRPVVLRPRIPIDDGDLVASTREHHPGEQPGRPGPHNNNPHSPLLTASWEVEWESLGGDTRLGAGESGSPRLVRPPIMARWRSARGSSGTRGRGGSPAGAGQPQSGTSDGEATQGRGPDRRAQDRPRRERGDGRDDEEQAAGASGSALADQGEEQQRAGDAGDDGDPEEGADRPGRVRDDQGARERRPGRHHQSRRRDLGGGERGRTSRCAQSPLKDGACGESCQAEQRPAERRDRRRSAEAVDQGDGDPGDAQRDAGPLPGREPVPAQGRAGGGDQQRRGAGDQGGRRRRRAFGHSGVEAAELHREEQDADCGHRRHGAYPVRPHLSAAARDRGQHHRPEDETPEIGRQGRDDRRRDGPTDVAAAPDRHERRAPAVRALPL